MSLIERTIKMLLATMAAIFLASQLQLSYAISAGIIALLGVLDTRKSSLIVARNRLLSFFLAFAVAVSLFALFGFGLLSLGLYLALTIPLLYQLKIEAGLVPITVLVTHLMSEQRIDLSILLNELLLFLIGTGLALLANGYMGSQEHRLRLYHQKIEDSLKAILYRFESFLLEGQGQNEGQMIKELELSLDEALKLVYRERHNTLFYHTNYQVHYFEMRRHQNRLLAQMALNVTQLTSQSRESILLSHLFHETARQLSEKNSALTLIDDIEQLLEVFRQRELPQTREEFERRAILFHLLQDLERFILLKVEFYRDYKEEQA
ncbi:aromatic acid exporter family protein [Streptococcus equi]|uniref:Putative membrane protein n=1 Tax=Streptococcus equi subsp. zooepidemicus (strain H70) TaxID=553483 RepID=C0MG84_STRS7|nr:aromatic acid exporter family protein [Streptococcus equi]HEL1016201.1 aromatic acid exporter family protein [Streptococcus equi subsp. ruminatorum]MCD3381629.1 aromatic acid exporter family protein [Streptococcus equi subsp. zooepidemicus]MCD3381632.1 aromatic acid exporter family protein [Streptococcus equi subsp. zooepidemicus]MCD3382575.1 aromatic acid exporter family protein [Streptococcus equi subsp. zooepidemicus]MCD3420426.1 aromatic acid exporter family protein [Streptococcus equi 